MHLTQKDIESAGRIQRLNLINSVTGIKPANLIGTKSTDGRPNVGIFSSVVHLGSSPALLGFFFRPQHEKPRDTYLNIRDTTYYTINHVPNDLVEKAHYTSAKFPAETSEFERCGFGEEYLDGFHAPYVRECAIKIGLKMVEEIPIPVNKTILMVGSIEHLYFPDEMQTETGQLDLEKAETSGVTGVDSYYSLQKIARFPYAHVKDVPNF